jgi:hypothetical protein
MRLKLKKNRKNMKYNKNERTQTMKKQETINKQKRSGNGRLVIVDQMFNYRRNCITRTMCVSVCVIICYVYKVKEFLIEKVRYIRTQHCGEK